VYVDRRHDGSTFEIEQRITEDTWISCPTTGQRGRRGSASRSSAPRVAGASARRRTAELLQLGLDQRGELIDLRQCVGVGVAAEEELLAVAMPIASAWPWATGTTE
jgi:hypothetical protein